VALAHSDERGRGLDRAINFSDAVYGLAMTVTGVLSTAVWQYASSGGLMDPRLSAAWRRAGWVRGLSVPLVFATSIPVAFVSTSAAQYWWILLVLQRGVLRRLLPGADEPFGQPEPTG
jgi:Na+-transporting NADH:ubiquinone oxidoreductase subunit NqrB